MMGSCGSSKTIYALALLCCCAVSAPGCASTAPPSAAPPAPAAPTTVQAGGNTVVAVSPAAAPCCPHCTLWEFLGVKHLFQGVGGLIERIRNRLGSVFPGLEATPPVLAITDPKMPIRPIRRSKRPRRRRPIEDAALAKDQSDSLLGDARLCRLLSERGRQRSSNRSTIAPSRCVMKQFGPSASCRASPAQRAKPRVAAARKC